MPAGVRGFISFHIEQSEIFHNVRQNIISHFAKQNISLYAFMATNAVFAKKRGQIVQKHSLSFFLSVSTIFYCTEDMKHWICEECFNDFKEQFNWQEKSAEELYSKI